MRFLVKFRMPVAEGNTALRDPEFGAKMQRLLQDIKAEAAYFTAEEGTRGGILVVNLDDPSQMPAVAEPLFLWLKAKVEFLPTMTPEDLAKAGPSIAAAIDRWGR